MARLRVQRHTPSLCLSQEGPKPFVPFKYDTSGPVPKQQERLEGTREHDRDAPMRGFPFQMKSFDKYELCCC